VQLYRNDSQSLVKAFQYIRNRGGITKAEPLMRKVLNLRGRVPKRIHEIARDILSVDRNFKEMKDGAWTYTFPAVFTSALQKECFVAVDVEATGGKPPVEKMVELGAIKYKNTNEVNEFSYLVNPEKPMQPFVARMTGINDELLSKAHAVDDVMKRFLDFIKDNILILHDPFPDMAFIDEAVMNCFGGMIINPIIDTLTLAKSKLGLHAGLSLAQIADKLDIHVNESHRALEDARATGKAYFILRELEDYKIQE